jgi:exodeoxyribonuclease-3
MLAWGEGERARGEKVVICGDWNTCHKEVDLKNWKANRKTSGFTDAERALIDEFVDVGWRDSFRELNPEATDVYSWWSNRVGVRERNVGWRIDYHFVSEELWPMVRDASVHMNVMGSDHCPVELGLSL